MSRFLFGMRPLDKRPPRPRLDEYRAEVTTAAALLEAQEVEKRSQQDERAAPSQRVACRNCRKSIEIEPTKQLLTLSPQRVYIGPADQNTSLEYFCTGECQWSFMFRQRWKLKDEVEGGL
mmetsp:Transcript_30984/g.50129  ORF Transcript_30984/g.50129 Transcript_30984/m.50129 type:complete len:120 (-) Transcript_30984:372-731(-)|eukprot:CAMPEP_0184648214 /NCGR_PEP_ID=MMETSP0308-20130426/5286_1 /TAXON_ID=38269 /ORGANISM="Gloeochaete witrockiana, Strain SAG 46.84" /LENGTH=119 /DNA_ID=CAMNT_0027079857 /DNA_START=221 /DNA_END=580 /DNA_ORIENTATION=-